MGKVYSSIDELVGKTPLLRLGKTEKECGLCAELYAKLECFNPAGSVKDRVALEMINDAEERGAIGTGAVIIEPTSGNTGIGIAAVCAARGYKAIIVMPDTMSVERQKLMRAYGAEVVLSDGALGMTGAIKLAEELHNKTPGSIIAGQFVNPANPAAHYKTTGPEIYEAMDGDVDILVACVGTGGTISGTGRYLKEKNPSIKVIAVEPKTSAVLSGERAGKHGIQGIGAGFVPEILDTGIYDEVIKVTDREAETAMLDVARREGVLVGISSGATLAAAKRVAMLKENGGKKIVVILPDTGERYLSCNIFN
ncbi:MAG: cysteine synthase A [Clostridia bacterium]|nr:cysteine synthase A [Clostridia bacterium]